jgi:hypothetical protein
VLHGGSHLPFVPVELAATCLNLKQGDLAHTALTESVEDDVVDGISDEPCIARVEAVTELGQQSD